MKQRIKEMTLNILKKADGYFTSRPFKSLLLFSLFLCLVIEMLCRRSIFSGLAYIFTSPVMFIFNTLIILLTFSPSLFVRRRYFYLSIVTAVWLGLGISNCVMLGFRVTPLGFIDVMLLRSVWSIIGVYLDLWQIALIILAIGVVGLLCVEVWRKSPLHTVRYIRASLCFALVALATFSFNFVGAKAGALPDEFGNLAMAYDKYGFAYCFSRSVVDRGIEESDDYSGSEISQLLSTLPDDKGADGEKPNVIFLQLESFFDANRMKSITYSENPIPNFTRLMSEYAHGALFVPSLGAGTANTEFEVLTGMSISHFGAGEYPYKTVLKDTTAESMAYNYSSLGYTTHAIHNHEGSFYDRNEIYSQLGFDTYTSIEYMKDVERNSLGWAKDTILIQNIFDSLASSEGSDFIFAVSVQAHGKYPREVIELQQRITLDGFDDEKIDIAFEYYVNQLYEEDEFVGLLTDALSELDEKVVLVMYGDHLPAFDMADEELSSGDVFATEYIIWANYDLMPYEERDMQAHELSAYVMEKLGFNAGVITKLHQTYRDDERFDELLEMFSYDALYGEKHIYGEKALVPSDLHMGLYEISVTDAQNAGKSAYIKGENFNVSSIVYINDKKKNTHYVDENTLYLPSCELDEGDIVTVAQAGEDGIVLSFSAQYVYGD